MKKIMNDEIVLQIMALMIFIFCLIGAEAKTLLIAGISFLVASLMLVPFVWMCLRYENNNTDID